MGPALAFLLLLQQPIETDPAVRKGMLRLKSLGPELQKDPELALWTLVAIGEPKTDPVVRGLLQGALARPPETTRSAALQALALSALRADEYRERIGHCAQFLVDNQCADGRWDAGRPVDPPTLPPLPPPPPRPPGNVRDFKGRPVRVREKIDIVRSRAGAKEGDVENSRWAAWGLLACHQDGFRFPPDLPGKAAAAWRDEGQDPADVVACLSIYRHLQDKDWRKDPDTLKALDALQVKDRADDPRRMFLLKRAMFLYNSATLRGKDWWSESVKALSAAQSPDGGWGGFEETCWGVLVLYVPRFTWPEPEFNRR